MWVNYKNVYRFQDGGQLPPETEEEMPEEGAAQEGAEPSPGDNPQDMLMQIAQAAQHALQNQDCETAMQVCEMFMQLAQGGGEAAHADHGEPVFARKGAKLLYHISR